MTKFVYNNLFGSNDYAGARPMGWRPKGVVIHNTAGSYGGGSDSASYYMNTYLPSIIRNGTAANGFAHYYCDKDLIFQCCDTRYGAWATANPDGNMNYVSYEVCEPGNKADFLANEQATFKQVAADMKFWGLTPSRSTVRLHQQFYQTACPWLSVKYHGGPQATQDYFIEQIKKYMDESSESDTNNSGPDTYLHSGRVKKVITKRDTGLYDGLALSKAKVLATIPKGTTLEVSQSWFEGPKETDLSRFKVEYKGQTGWVSGNDDIVESAYWLMDNYGSKHRVKMLDNDYAYEKKDLSGHKTPVKKGEVFTVVENVTDGAGYPRLKLKSGLYISALKCLTEWI